MLDESFFLKHQRLLLLFSNTKFGKDILGHGLDKVDLILPNAVFKKEGKVYTAEFRTHDKYAKRLFYEFKPIWKAFHWFDLNIANVFIPRLNLGFDSLTAYPEAGAVSPVDGHVFRSSDQAFADIRAGAGTGFSNTANDSYYARLGASTTLNQFANLYRSIFCFDTSSLGASASISAAVFSLWGGGADAALGATTYDVVAATPAATNTLENSDYAQLDTVVFADVAGADFNNGSYEDFTLDANGIANVNKTGISNFGMRLGWDTDISFGGSWASTAETYKLGKFADEAGTANDPKLVVTYTSGTSGLQRKYW